MGSIYIKISRAKHKIVSVPRLFKFWSLRKKIQLCHAVCVRYIEVGICLLMWSCHYATELLQRRPGPPQWPGELPPDLEAIAPPYWREDVRAARSAAQALYSCAGSRRNRMMMRKDGVVPLIARLIQSDKAQLLVPIIGLLNHFAKEVNDFSVSFYFL